MNWTKNDFLCFKADSKVNWVPLCILNGFGIARIAFTFTQWFGSFSSCVTADQWSILQDSNKTNQWFMIRNNFSTSKVQIEFSEKNSEFLCNLFVAERCTERLNFNSDFVSIPNTRINFMNHVRARRSQARLHNKTSCTNSNEKASVWMN